MNIRLGLADTVRKVITGTGAMSVDQADAAKPAHAAPRKSAGRDR
jgi:hypothetical protein